ncbi:hypothetical protein QBC35DRAFT_466845 [Podospora australis]|uniref:Mid2 domain-containing protein n=1 Tax=Podospora australis TaxID=1536484 RepID=A0AAN6WMD4_9PEZI|nr:hypothetical protein QBC35DRAFT_466845 [Podospora australis]
MQTPFDEEFPVIRPLGAVDFGPPLPTKPPVAIRDIVLRQNPNTQCGYLNGLASNPITCPEQGTCSTSQGYVACCPSGQTCNIFSSCLDYAAFTRGLCSNLGPQTLCCSNTALSYCNVLTYVDKPGQSLIGCNPAQYAAAVYATPTSTTSTSSTSSDPVVSTTSTSSDTGADIGAIVGGVIGGILLLAVIIGLLVWFILRRKKKKTAAAQDPMAALNSPAAMSPMASPPVLENSMASTGPFDPRNSVFKPAYGGGGQVSPGISPGFGGPPPVYNRFSPYGEGEGHGRQERQISEVEATEARMTRTPGQPAEMGTDGASGRPRGDVYEM